MYIIIMYKAALVLVWTALAARLTPIRLGAYSIMPKRPRRDHHRRRSQTSNRRSHFITHPRPLNERERTLIFLYSYCQLGMTPQQFYSKWDVTYEDIALICCRSHSVVLRWFQRGRAHLPPHANDLRHLALMDFMLEHFEEIPKPLFDMLCSPH